MLFGLLLLKQPHRHPFPGRTQKSNNFDKLNLKVDVHITATVHAIRKMASGGNTGGGGGGGMGGGGGGMFGGGNGNLPPPSPIRTRSGEFAIPLA